MSRMFRFVAALGIALLPAAAMAQAGTGTITGVVRDASGGALPGAVVRIVNEATGVGREVVADLQGTYRAEELAPGQYRVETSFDGFDAAVRRSPVGAGQTVSIDVVLTPSRVSEGVTVTARRTEEAVQEVPIPVAVVTGSLIADAGTLNVGRIQDLVPTVQFYSTNPRNTTLNIRGLGSTLGLTNDGIEPGVGLYVDGVFYARPAATTFDFIDVAQVEVLRGPQGTLFGKNTTAGAINVTTRRPSFTRETNFELSYGDRGFVQAKASVTGPLGKKIAGRISFSGTQRDGTVFNVATQDDVNDLNNVGVRGQVLITPTDRVAITFSADGTRQRPEGYAQVIAGVAPTLRPANRQWAAIAADLGYDLPSYNAFDRTIDTDTPWQSNQDLGGASLNVDWNVGSGRITSTTAWRYWNWDPSNDRDWTGLSAVELSQAPSKQRQWTQEVRYAGDISPRIGLVVGFFTFGQNLKSDPFHTTQAGADAWRYSLAPSANASTPGLLDGYGENTKLKLDTVSSAVFGQLELKVTDRLRLLPGLRVNYDKKDMDFDRQTYGGLQTTNPALIALQQSVYSPQAYTADVNDANVSGQATVAYQLATRVHTYATYATSFKSVGLNLGGVPNDPSGQPALDAATVKPEDTKHVEAGVKTEPFPGVTANFTVYNTAIKDFQAQVQNAQLGVQRGYLASADKVRVRGFEFDGTARLGNKLSLYSSVAYTDGIYVKFVDAPVALEDTGGAAQSVDISGQRLPAISKWALSIGGEAAKRASLLGSAGQVFGAIDANYRTSFSSSPTPSRYLVVDGYGLINARVGFRAADGWALFLWARNLLDKDYYESLQPGAGGTGLYTAQLGDPRAVGVTLRVNVATRGN